jgi:transcriptional regulator with XRE-family HTH domain
MAEAFAPTLRTWRLTRGLSQAALAKRIMYSRSLVNLIENGYRQATEAFARAADTTLDAAGQLHAAWHKPRNAPTQPMCELSDPSTVKPAAAEPDCAEGGGRAANAMLVRPDVPAPGLLVIVIRVSGTERKPVVPPPPGPAFRPYPVPLPGQRYRCPLGYNDPRHGLYRGTSGMLPPELTK